MPFPVQEEASLSFVITRYIRDLTASLLTEVCHDVRVEPDLQPVTGEMMTGSTSNTNDGARLDIAVNGFWGGRFEKTYMDVRVFCHGNFGPAKILVRGTKIPGKLVRPDHFSLKI